MRYAVRRVSPMGALLYGLLLGLVGWLIPGALLGWLVRATGPRRTQLVGGAATVHSFAPGSRHYA